MTAFYYSAYGVGSTKTVDVEGACAGLPQVLDVLVRVKASAHYTRVSTLRLISDWRRTYCENGEEECYCQEDGEPRHVDVRYRRRRVRAQANIVGLYEGPYLQYVDGWWVSAGAEAYIDR